MIGIGWFVFHSIELWMLWSLIKTFCGQRRKTEEPAWVAFGLISILISAGSFLTGQKGILWQGLVPVGFALFGLLSSRYLSFSAAEGIGAGVFFYLAMCLIDVCGVSMLRLTMKAEGLFRAVFSEYGQAWLIYYGVLRSAEAIVCYRTMKEGWRLGTFEGVYLR